MTTTKILWLLAVGLLCLTHRARATQHVFLDFDSRTGASDRSYSGSERDAILALVEQDYALFDFAFAHEAAPTAPFSTVFLNDGPELGLAEAIDFRNLDSSDNATVEIGDNATTSAEFVTLTANVVSHELGHLLGLRHGDSFGPIGGGIDTGTFPDDFADPTYPGPQSADETRFHIMETDDLFFEDRIDLYFSERSAVRLSFNERGVVIDEAAGTKGSLAAAQPIELAELTVPNTVVTGQSAELQFDVEALVVTGRIGVTGEADYYRFDGQAGDLFSFEVLSETPDRITDIIDPQVTLLDAAGTPIDYYGEDAFNDDDFEGFDSILLDLLLPADGTYYAKIESYDGSDAVVSERRGNYELFAYRFATVEASLAGDFTGDGVVDAADYTLWRDTLDQSGNGLAADGNNDGRVNDADYAIWSANLGAIGLAELNTVPEGTAGSLCLLALSGRLGMRRPR